jgi:hypothetical protein
MAPTRQSHPPTYRMGERRSEHGEVFRNLHDALISVNSMHLCELQAASGTQATGTG